MPRKPAINPSVNLHVMLPPQLAARLQLYLYSPVEGRIPQGAYQRFFTERLIEFFNQKGEGT